MAHLYKSRLQNYAQKRSIPFPTYADEMQGPPHARQFKARVTVEGVTYEGPEFCSNLKDAEHAAAKVAFMSLSPAEAQEVQFDDRLYKSLLQELAQKKGLLLPIYATNRTGPPHMPCFVSAVEIAGERFMGQEARTKKQAEMNAAKVAYTTLTEGGSRVNTSAVSSDIHMVGASNFGSSSVQPVVTDNKEPSLVLTAFKIRINIKDQASYPTAMEAKKRKGEAMEKHMLTLQPIMVHNLLPKASRNVESMQLNVVRENLLTQAGQTHGGPESNGKRNQGNRFFVNDDVPKSIMDPGSAIPPRTKIVIHQHKPGMIYDGTIQFADDEWVAMKVNM